MALSKQPANGLPSMDTESSEGYSGVLNNYLRGALRLWAQVQCFHAGLMPGKPPMHSNAFRSLRITLTQFPSPDSHTDSIKLDPASRTSGSSRQGACHNASGNRRLSTFSFECSNLASRTRCSGSGIGQLWKTEAIGHALDI